MTKKEMKQWIKENKWKLLVGGSVAAAFAISLLTDKPRLIEKEFAGEHLYLDSTHMDVLNYDSHTGEYKLYFNDIFVSDLGDVGDMMIEDLIDIGDTTKVNVLIKTQTA